MKKSIMVFLFSMVLVSASAFAVRLGVPEIISPEDIAEFRGVETVIFKWKSVPGASRYHITLAKDRNFKDIIFEDSEIGNSGVGDVIEYSVNYLNYGTYAFKVNAVSLEGTEGPTSEPRIFIISTPVPYLSIENMQGK